METKPDPNWETATWEGSRLTQLRVALAMTVRERFEALDGLIELSRHLAEMPRKPGKDDPVSR
jgi:hypothetical protein